MCTAFLKTTTSFSVELTQRKHFENQHFENKILPADCRKTAAIDSQSLIGFDEEKKIDGRTKTFLNCELF